MIYLVFCPLAEPFADLKIIIVAWEPQERIPSNGVDVPKTFPAGVPRVNEEGLAMWATLFAVTAVIAVALSLAAIVVDSNNGGKFRL